ncbi:hypothetical protein MRX96_050419, partial [Rhipicephalus microplus]
VMMYVNKVGPYFNPHETYHYYQLPVCRPDKIVHRSLTLGEILDGDRMAESMYKIEFKVNVEKKVLCTVNLSAEDFKKLKEAIEDLYYFEFVLDGLRLWGFIGQLEEGSLIPHKHKLYLWTHLTFNIEYNGKEVISANVTVTDGVPLLLDEMAAPLDITHTYSVRWLPTNTLEVHWLSVINSLVLIFLLLGFIGVILTRVLKNDIARYNSMESKAEMDVEEYGWKIIHADVFRFPPYKNLLCAILGVGTQFLCIAVGVLLMALLSVFNVHNHGSMNTAICVLYALTSCIAGFVSSKMYRQMGGEPTGSQTSTSSPAFSFCLSTTVVLLLLVWVCCGYPLTLMGGILGKNCAGPFEAPLPSQADCERSATCAVVSLPACPLLCGWLPALQCHLGGTVLHLLDRVGAGALHAVRHPPGGGTHPVQRDGQHSGGAHLLPALLRGLPLVVEGHLHRR